MKGITLIILGIIFWGNSNNVINACNTTVTVQEKDTFLNDLKHRTFNYFWDLHDSITWQTPDRYPTKIFTSIAATGFGLAAYIVGIENKYISRQQGVERVLNTIKWLHNSVQGSDSTGATGYKGFYYHFLTYKQGLRYKNVELSTIDTGWLMAGILTCQSYFDGNTEEEKQIRNLADSLYLRVDWNWAMNGQEFMSMGWHPEDGFINAHYLGYSEAMMLMILSLGSPTHATPDSTWNSYCKNYKWADFYGYQHLNFEPLFGHQYSHMFIDFREIYDPYIQQKGIDYFENSRRATLANRAYCIKNPMNFNAYSDSIWGLTACDGPIDSQLPFKGNKVQFYTYRARGASIQAIVDDGSIAPTAAGGSIPFTPDESLQALMAMKKTYGEKLYQQYGFKDAFNPSYITDEFPQGWFDKDYIGLDQGPIVIQIENYQTGLIWNLMKKNKYIVNGLKKAGFKGGWLENHI
ncbi:MAG: Tat pathway signal protein [Bacteroidales bacterium]|nr:Tat pathway signal protein [Bacteroidales bacterium]